MKQKKTTPTGRRAISINFNHGTVKSSTTKTNPPRWGPVSQQPAGNEFAQLKGTCSEESLGLLGIHCARNSYIPYNPCFWWPGVRIQQLISGFLSYLLETWKAILARHHHPLESVIPATKPSENPVPPRKPNHHCSANKWTVPPHATVCPSAVVSADTTPNHPGSANCMIRM